VRDVFVLKKYRKEEREEERENGILTYVENRFFK